MSSIYKFYINNNNHIERILVFIGNYLYLNHSSIYDLEQMLENIKNQSVDETENIIFAEIFAEAELKEIIKNNIVIEFVEDTIYKDDTIEIVKYKLLNYLHNNIVQSGEKLQAFEDLYMYIYIPLNITKSSNISIIWNKLTQHGKLELTHTRLRQFLLNADNGENDKIQEQSSYSYDDFAKIIDNFSGNSDTINNVSPYKQSLGQKLIGGHTEFIYTYNPFEVEAYDPLLKSYAEKLISTNNKSLLFEQDIINNAIYVCMFNDVHNYHLQNLKDDIITTFKIYYPFLFNIDINSIDTYNISHESLLSKTRSKIAANSAFMRANNSITMFNHIAEKINQADQKHTTERAFRQIEHGIKKIELCIYPISKINLPLDIIFKIVHSTREIPLIKFNQGKRQENIYRLYSEKLTVDGRKIPFLTKGVIFRLIKTIGLSKSISFYIQYNPVETTNIRLTKKLQRLQQPPIIVEVRDNASICVKLDFDHPQDLMSIQTIVAGAVNPIINDISTYLSQSGYILPDFQSILEPNVEITGADYFANIEINSPFNFQKIKGCINGLFNIINPDLKDGIVMRYKRVANYNEMNAIESNIVELLKRNYRERQIIENLQDNYNLQQKA